MPQFRGATYFNLKGGLNTEASPLNIPVTDATEIQNIDINVDGSVQRRRAIDYVGQSSLGNHSIFSPITDYTTINGGVFRSEVSSFAQFNPINAAGRISKHIVVHVGNAFYIYDYTSPELLREIDAPKQTLWANLTDTQNALYSTDFLQDGQRLYILNQKLQIGYIEYLAATDTFVYVTSRVQQRVNTATTSTITNVNPTITDGWTAGVLCNSRLWVAGSVSRPNTIYFSQIIINGDEYAKMYQVADPFSISDNQLVDTDGGSIQLKGAEQILAIAPLGSGVIVFANNGVWSIAGQDGFRPTSFSINKISSAGIIGSKCWAAVEQQLVYFGQTDVYTVLLGTALDTPEIKPIGNKIVSFYNNLPKYNRTSGKAVYNPDTKKLYFFCNFNKLEWHVAQNPNTQHTMSRDALVMDVRLAAWSTYRLKADNTGDLVAIGDSAVFDGGPINLELTTSNGIVITSGGISVTAQAQEEINSRLSLNFLLLKKLGVRWTVSFGELSQTAVVDFADQPLQAETNRAFITLAHQLFNDVAVRKFAPYIIPLFERMESGLLDINGVDITPGGCLYRVDWDWSTSAQSARFGTLRSAYKPYRFTLSRFDGVDPGVQIVSSRLKIRGRGDVFRLHFESDGTKDFKLYGWQLLLHTKKRF